MPARGLGKKSEMLTLCGYIMTFVPRKRLRPQCVNSNVISFIVTGALQTQPKFLLTMPYMTDSVPFSENLTDIMNGCLINICYIELFGAVRNATNIIFNTKIEYIEL